MKRSIKRGKILLIIIYCISIISLLTMLFNIKKVKAITDINDIINITYDTHIENIGWQKTKSEGQIAGTEGKSLRLEAIKINNMNKDFNIKYKVHIENIGWQDWKKNGEIAGTEGQSLRMEAIQIKLENTIKYNIEYRVHIQNIGWQDWKKNGEVAGTEGQSLRLEAIEIKITDNNNIVVYYQSHVQNIGWQEYMQDGVMSGTQGQSLRDEAIKIKINNVPVDAGITYTSYVEGYGWQDWKKDGEMSGTEGKSLRLESIKIKLINLEEYTVKYRIHIENIGWTTWKEDGEQIGQPKSGLRIEAIEIKIEKKANVRLTGIDVSVYQGNIDWNKVKQDNVSFAMIRAAFRGWGESGSLNEDKNFRYNAENAVKNGVNIGAYFFSQAVTEEEAVEEANFILNIIKNYKITYPVVIDVEYANEQHTGRADGLSIDSRTKICIAFAEKIKQAGYIPMVYTGKYFATSNLDMNRLKDYDFWLAHYTGANQINPLDKPSNYEGSYTIWQYTSKGRINGIVGDVDMDIVYKIYN